MGDLGRARSPQTTVATEPNGIFANSSYAGRSAEGIFLGMPKAEALRICDESYSRTETSDDQVEYGRGTGGGLFILSFEGDLLDGIKFNP